MATAATVDGTDNRLRAPLRLLEAPALRGADRHDPGYQAYLILRSAFVVAPLLFGLDKFFNWMVPWTRYLWVGFSNHLPGTPHQIMMGVGVVEMVAGLLVAVVPRLAPYVVAGWLAGIVTDLVITSASIGGHTAVFWDIALRDFGLMLAALALARLAAVYAPPLIRAHGTAAAPASAPVARAAS
ncbi:MAG TPA: hypothetical protein VFH45_13450 [Acidimicrobiales bacterium]|nr:hypothetical protein [Acidimicrobiales bacterium]